MKRLAPRQMMLGGLLAVSLAATAWVASREEADVAPTLRRPRLSAASPAVPLDWPGPAARMRSPWPEVEAVAARAWGDASASLTATPLPPASVAEDAPPDAAAPPSFPYRLVGRMTDTHARAVLDGAQRSLVVGVNDLVDGQWRIEAIESTGLRVKHLPNGPSQLIAFSSS